MTAITIPNTFIPSTTISSTEMNDNFTAVANAILASAAKDGSDTFTGQLKLANGTAALPSLTFGTDPNTGIYRRGADELGFSTNGIEKAYLDTNGQFVLLAGTAAAPSYTFASDLDTGIYRKAANAIGFSTNGVERGYFDTTNFASTLALFAPDGTNSLPAYGFSSDADTGMYWRGADDLGFTVGGTLRMHIQGASTVLGNNDAIVGVSTITSALQIQGVATGSASIMAARFSADISEPLIQFVKSRNASLGGHTVVQSGDVFGSILFGGSDGTNFIQGAAIQVRCDATPGTNDMPGRIELRTTADGASSTSERMRISNGGNAYFPGVSTTGSAANAFLNSGSSPANELLRSTSSLRYKRDIEDLETDYADALLKARPVWYRSKCEADPEEFSYYGLIAEELAEIDPRLVHWGYAPEAWRDEIVERKLDDGSSISEMVRTLKKGAKKVPDGVTYDRLTVLLLSIIQRQEKRITALEQR